MRRHHRKTTRHRDHTDVVLYFGWHQTTMSLLRGRRMCKQETLDVQIDLNVGSEQYRIRKCNTYRLLSSNSKRNQTTTSFMMSAIPCDVSVFWQHFDKSSNICVCECMRLHQLKSSWYWVSKNRVPTKRSGHRCEHWHHPMVLSLKDSTICQNWSKQPSNQTSPKKTCRASWQQACTVRRDVNGIAQGYLHRHHGRLSYLDWQANITPVANLARNLSNGHFNRWVPAGLCSQCVIVVPTVLWDFSRVSLERSEKLSASVVDWTPIFFSVPCYHWPQLTESWKSIEFGSAIILRARTHSNTCPTDERKSHCPPSWIPGPRNKMQSRKHVTSSMRSPFLIKMSICSMTGLCKVLVIE